DIADARIEIEDVQGGASAGDAGAPPTAGSRAQLAWVSPVALVALIAAAIAGWFLRPVPAPPEARLQITTPPTTDPSLAISPDGSKLVFAGRSGTQSQLWLRALDSTSIRPLAGTERATQPFWSPDSRSIGFFADAKLKRMDIDGGSVKVLLSQSAVPIGGTWNRDDTILFNDNPGGPIMRISA